MKTLDRKKLDVTNKTCSNPASRDWRGHITPEFVLCLAGAYQLTASSDGNTG